MARQVRGLEEGRGEMSREINKCKDCGSDAEIRVSFGGPCTYYAVHCLNCNNSSRGVGNILPQLYSEPSNDSFPVK